MSCYSEPGFVLLGLSGQPVTANTSLHTSDTTAADIYRSWNFPSWVWASPQMPVAWHELLHGAWGVASSAFVLRVSTWKGKRVSNIFSFTQYKVLLVRVAGQNLPIRNHGTS